MVKSYEFGEFGWEINLIDSVKYKKVEKSCIWG